MEAMGLPSAALDRRAFLRMAGTAFAASLGAGPAFALARTDAVFASGYMGSDGLRAQGRFASWSLSGAVHPCRKHTSNRGMATCEP